MVFLCDGLVEPVQGFVAVLVVVLGLPSLIVGWDFAVPPKLLSDLAQALYSEDAMVAVHVTSGL
jgi:hypothetical protein